MGAATILAIAASDVHEIYDLGAPFIFALWVLWWIVVAISLACCWGSLHIMFVLVVQVRLDPMLTVRP